MKTVKTLGEINIFEKMHISQKIFTKKLENFREKCSEKNRKGSEAREGELGTRLNAGNALSLSEVVIFGELELGRLF